MKDMKLIEMVLDDEKMEFGIHAISLVERPAIESDFIALAQEELKIKLATLSEEKQILMGPALIPDRPILRIDENNEPYQIYFSKETVKKASERFLTLGNQNNATLHHLTNVNDISVVESWIVSDDTYDKSRLYDLLDAPVGT